MRAFVTATLEAEGRFEVVTAASGFEALKLLPRERFDLFVTDINMPDINGLELIRFIRESAAHGKAPLVSHLHRRGRARSRPRHEAGGQRLPGEAVLARAADRDRRPRDPVVVMSER